MKLTIQQGNLHCDGRRICAATPLIPIGRYDLEVAYSHAYREVLPQIVGVGWFGREVLVPESAMQRIIDLIQDALDSGNYVTLDIYDW